jgi:superfamily II DNA or RNA helicase
MSSFQRYAPRLRLTQSVVGDGRLREAQLGALLALGAHAARSDDAAQLILPTGVGKTAVATLSPYLLAANKVLVVVPGRLIAEQVRAAFEDVQRLIDWQVLPRATRPPRVEIAKHLATAANWKQWKRSADVVIGTPNVLSPMRDGVDPLPKKLFDLIIFDEAHHLPANTWTSLYKACGGRAVLLTATPFRNDKQRLPGEIAFTYPLTRAFEKRVFGAVAYRPVMARTGVGDDQVLAEAAVARLTSPEHVAANSRLLVRTNRVASADELAKIYDRLEHRSP